MALPWFSGWLRTHLQRHESAGLPDPTRNYLPYEGWEKEFEYRGISERSADVASVRILSQAPAAAWHFKSLMKAAQAIEEAARKRAEEYAATAPKPIEDEPVPRGQDLRECIALARGNGPLARLYRVMFRRLITAGKIDPNRIPDDAWEERPSDKADDHKSIIPRLTRVH